MNHHSRNQSQSTPQSNPNPQETSAALLEQLVYIDTFINGGGGQTTPNLDADGQLSMELAAFADDSFVFPDETKSEADHRWNNNDFDEPHSSSSAQATATNQSNNQSNGQLGGLPKFPVPPGAKSSLESAGLSSNQIDLLSALVAQHQQSLGKQIPSTNLDQSVTPSTASTSSLSSSYPMAPLPIFDLASGFGSTPSHTQHQHHHQSQFSSSVYSSLVHPSPSSSEDNASQASPSSTELDKRRRNTAASARFRIKKKMKEKQMESRIVELNSTVKDFESKISRLEMENKLLRNLIIEKGSQKSDDELKQLKEKVMRRNE